MKFKPGHTLEYVVIDDFYNDRELALIWREIHFLSSKLLPPEHTNSAKDEHGCDLKKNSGIFLDKVYQDRDASDILAVNRKLWSPEVIDRVEKISPWWRLLAVSNYDCTLLNYYQDNEYYEPHSDHAVITAVTILHSQPSNFSGGDFVFAEHGITVSCRSNSVIIFPSVVKHGVTPVQLRDSTLENSGRYSLAQFLYLGSAVLDQ